jgi:hypothetical protein
MAKPVLSFNDPRVKKLWTTHAVLCRRGKEFKFHLLDNLPENWDKVRVVRIATPGLTISESLAKANKELKHLRIKSCKRIVRQ